MREYEPKCHEQVGLVTGNSKLVHTNMLAHVYVHAHTSASVFRFGEMPPCTPNTRPQDAVSRAGQVCMCVVS